MHQATQPWGQHLILDFAGCPRHFLTDPDHLRAWVTELVDAIKMRAFGAPSIEHFATHSFESAGYTVIQLIETSNICAHFAENLGQVYIDIFSCKEFDNAVAEDVCRRYFAPSTVIATPILRGAFALVLAEVG